MPLIKNGAYAEDAFTAVADDAGLPDAPVVVSLTRFRKERDALLARNTKFGVRLKSDESPSRAGRRRATTVSDRAGVSQIPRRARVFLGADAAHAAGL